MKTTLIPILVLALSAIAPSPAQVADKYAAAAKSQWEATIKKFEELDKKSDYPADSILFMGSSSIRLWDTLARDMAPYPVIQRGYGGAKFQDLAVFAERIVHPHEFRALVIFVANDIVGKDSDLAPEEVAALYQDVVATVRKKNAEAPVFLIAITPTQSRWKAWPQIQKANAAMEAVCQAQENVHFIRTEEAFINGDRLPKTELFRDDQLHLNADGYQLWTKIVRKELERVLAADATKHSGLQLERDGHWLVIRGASLPGGELRINYLEAYCRPGSTDADWVKHTVIPHENQLVSLSDDRKTMKLRDSLQDGVTVEHTIAAGQDEVSFELVAHNPTGTVSEAHWAQPCVRLGDFTGSAHGTDLSKGDIDDYLPKCFVFIDGKLARMPTAHWATEARYTPGQVWCPKHVPRSDVNPRPLSKLVPSNGLIGCFSGDEQLIFATAWEPYQELFQGVARCLHSDFRIGGLAPGETKKIRGKIYLMANDVPALLHRYAEDFPEHHK